MELDNLEQFYWTTWSNFIGQDGATFFVRGGGRGAGGSGERHSGRNHRRYHSYYVFHGFISHFGLHRPISHVRSKPDVRYLARRPEGAQMQARYPADKRLKAFHQMRQSRTYIPGLVDKYRRMRRPRPLRGRVRRSRQIPSR